MSDDPIAGRLDRRFRRCCQPRRHDRIQQRWARYPALARRTLPELRDVLRSPTADTNTVLADLIRAHQAGDGDATTVVLCALIPYVCRDPAIAVGPDRIADRWAALGHLLATVDPTDVDHPNEHRPFVHVLVGRMRRHASRLRYGPDRHVDPDADFADVVDLRPTSAGAVENQVLARLDLETIACHLHAGTINPARWQCLVEDRIHGVRNRSARTSISHTARRVAELTGHVA